MELVKALKGRGGPPGGEGMVVEEDKSAGAKKGGKGGGVDRENVVRILRFRENLPKGGEPMSKTVNGPNALFCMGLEKCHVVVFDDRACGRKSLQSKCPGESAVAGHQPPEGLGFDHRKREGGHDPHIGKIGHVDRRDAPQI